MGKVEKIEGDVRALSRRELSVSREWFRRYDSEEWDRQIEGDVRAGKFDKLAVRSSCCAQGWKKQGALHYRALAVEVPEGLLWFWIGSHADYDKIVG